MLQRLRRIPELIVEAAVLSLESLIERLGDPDRVAGDRAALRSAHERLAEFAEENARLEDEIVRWTDRVESLESILAQDGTPSGRARPETPRSHPPSGCNCGTTFRTAEDFRDHLPCEGKHRG